MIAPSFIEQLIDRCAGPTVRFPKEPTVIEVGHMFPVPTFDSDVPPTSALPPAPRVVEEVEGGHRSQP